MLEHARAQAQQHTQRNPHRIDHIHPGQGAVSEHGRPKEHHKEYKRGAVAAGERFNRGIKHACNQPGLHGGCDRPEYYRRHRNRQGQPMRAQNLAQ